MNIAFAGLRHSHIFELYNMAKENPYYNITGVFEDDKTAISDAALKGITVTTENYDMLICDENCHVIALGGCYGDRGEMAIKALEAGKHVIADKPLCTSLDELERIESLSKEKGLFVSCMFTMRFERKINAVKKLYESGKLGEINNIYFGGQHPLQYGRRADWYFEGSKHGGTVNDIAVHAVDSIRFMFGLEIEDIIGVRCWNKFAKYEPDFKDSAQLMAIAQNGAGIIGDVSYAVPDGIEFKLPYYWQFYIWGTKGSISFSLNEENTYYYVAGDPAPWLLYEEEIHTDYLSDFYSLTQGSGNTVITTREVIESTRKTLEMQDKAL